MATSQKVIDRSYKAYLSQRAMWKEKGYGLDRALTADEYKVAFLGLSHARKPNIARDLASSDRTLRYKQAATIRRRLKNAVDYEDADPQEIQRLLKKYSNIKKLISIELTEEESRQNEEMRRQRYLERGITPQRIIQATGRSQLFNELRDAGLSYKEAEKVLYG